MSDRDLNRTVARRTGESVESIQRLGFQVLSEHGHDDNDHDVDDYNLGPKVFDWDALQAASLGQVLSDEDWSGRVEPLPRYDEQFEFDEDDLSVAA